MKNTKFLLGGLVIALVLGITVVGCGGDGDPPTDLKFTLQGGGAVAKLNGAPGVILCLDDGDAGNTHWLKEEHIAAYAKDAASYTWAIKSGSDKITLTPGTTSSERVIGASQPGPPPMYGHAAVAAKAKGDAVITVTATNDKGSISAELKVWVKDKQE